MTDSKSSHTDDIHVMLSIHVKTMSSSASELQTYLESFGIKTWVCTQMQGGSNYRNEIVAAVKSCYVFLPLINDEWAASGECEDEFSLAKRKNLTSYEMKTSVAPQPRRPVILPIAFPNLDWSKYLHVELLASKTNFIVHAADTLADSEAREQTFRVLLESVYNTLTAMKVKLPADSVTKINSAIGSNKRVRTSSTAEAPAALTTKSSGEDLVESLSFYLHKSLDLHRQLAGFMKQQQQSSQTDLQDDLMKEYKLKKRYFGTSVKTLSSAELGIEQRSWFSGELTFNLGEAISPTTNKLDAVITWQNLRQSLAPQDARSGENWGKLPSGLKPVMEFLLDSVGQHWEWKLCGTFDKPTGEIELHVVSVPKAIIFSATSVTKFLVSKSGDRLEGYFFDSNDSFKGQGSFRFSAF